MTSEHFNCLLRSKWLGIFILCLLVQVASVNPLKYSYGSGKTLYYYV